MMNFRLKITEVINEMRDGYVEEAQVQQHLAKTDFLKLVAATIKKIHDVSHLTEEEKDELMEALHEKRTEFGDAVMAYINEVTDETEQIILDLTTELTAIETSFTEDVSTDVVPTNPVDSTVNQVEKVYDDLLEEVKAKAASEMTIAEQMKDEIMTWLENHIEDLQEALREICENEHAYHYTPPGFHVDETAVDLRVFQ
jgi:alkanesulfonate monooxygenase SsuD/methylene tetrahydromethanopterin reductase-like flavin-dependent oxidoreductase (luciferase family)